MNRLPSLAFAGLVAALLALAGGAPSEARSGLNAPAVSCDNPLGPVPPPPREKPAPPSIDGVADIGEEIVAGVLRVRVLCGVDLDDALARVGLAAEYEYLSPPPFDASDHRAGFDRSFRVFVPAGTETELVERLWSLREGAFDRVQLESKPWVNALLGVNDPYYPSQSNLAQTNIGRAWDRTVSWNAIIVAVIDSGLRSSHEEFPNWKEVKGYDYVRGMETPPGTAIDSNQVDPADCYGGHGTHVSSIAVADTNNGRGIAGAGFNSAILPMRVLYDNEAVGPNTCDGWAASTRDWPIRWARINGALVINMSYVQGYDSWVQDAVREAWANGATPVAGAGNEGLNLNVYGPRYPCGYSYVICVGAAKLDGTLCSVSNYGSTYVDYSAPAEYARGAGAAYDSKYIYDNCHTSYATPLLSGVAALLRSIGKGPQAQHEALAATARPEAGSRRTAFGIIDAGAALWR